MTKIMPTRIFNVQTSFDGFRLTTPIGSPKTKEFCPIPEWLMALWNIIFTRVLCWWMYLNGFSNTVGDLFQTDIYLSNLGINFTSTPASGGRIFLAKYFWVIRIWGLKSAYGLFIGNKKLTAVETSGETGEIERKNRKCERLKRTLQPKVRVIEHLLATIKMHNHGICLSSMLSYLMSHEKNKINQKSAASQLSWLNENKIHFKSLCGLTYNASAIFGMYGWVYISKTDY